MSEADATTKPAEEPKVESTEEQKPAEAPEAAKEDAKDDTKDKKPSNILKTKGKIDYDNHQNNRKFDPTARSVSDDPAAIRKQVCA